MLMMDDDDRVQDQLAGSNSKQQDDQRVASRHQNFHNKQNSKSRTKKICISVAKFVCSTFGLGIIVAGYSALGGFIFMHLEQTNELETCKSSRELYYNALNDTVSRMKILLVSYKNDEDVHNAAASMQTILRQFRDNSVNYDWNTTRVCELLGTAEGQSYQWNLVSAILFSVTITTTVGYGNIAPVTFWGRLVSIAYALMGIPLMLMFLGNIGGIFAKVIRFFYSKICCCGCLISPKKKQPSSSSSQSNLDRTNKSSSPSSNSDDSMEQWKKQFEAAAAARNEQQNTAQGMYGN